MSSSSAADVPAEPADEACEEGDAFGASASGVTASLARHLARVADLRESRFQW